MDSRYDVLIVGAGHGGAQAAIALRGQGFAGSIGLIGDEAELPYARPPLSKEYLAGDRPFERLHFRPANYWEEKRISLLFGQRAVAVLPDRQEIQLKDGSRIGYGHLVWAAGGEPRKVPCPGADLHGVYGVRNKADADAIMAELDGVQQVVVIGGGYIGLEAASVFTKLGKRVVVLEAQSRILARVAGEDISRFFEAEHRAHGVDLRTGVTITGLAGDTEVTGVRLNDGTLIPADMVIAGIGISPNVEPLRAAGASGDNGVRVDAQCRTDLPNVFAIGDCAAHASRFAGGQVIRLESVQNATDMANVVAMTICGETASYAATPWFWSNQYELKFQTVGLSAGYDQAIVRGEPESRSFSVIYLRNGTVIALDCVNNVRDYSHGRCLVELGARVAPEDLADSACQLKEWATSPITS